jgi:hypothetical protein
MRESRVQNHERECAKLTKQRLGMRMYVRNGFREQKLRSVEQKKDAKRDTLFAYGNVNNLGQVEC